MNKSKQGIYNVPDRIAIINE